MNGYQTVLDAAIRGDTIKHLWLYVDASPFRPAKPTKGLPPGVVVAKPDDDPAELGFQAFFAQTVYICGTSKERVLAFANAVWQVWPTKLVISWPEEMEVWHRD